MNNLDALLEQVRGEALALGIPLARQIDPHVHINRRAVTRFGCCIRQGEGYVIELSERMCAAPEQACRQTLAHELLHTCPGCGSHGPRWKAYAARMNQAYGYDIARTHTPQALGVPDTAPVRHLVVCRQCGRVFPRARASALVLHPERYRCRCGGTLERKF